MIIAGIIAVISLLFIPASLEVDYGTDLEEYKVALETSRKLDKPLLILFTTDECLNGIKTNKLIKESKAVRELIINDFVFLELVVNRETVERFATFECNKFSMNKQPYYVITTHEERVIDTSSYIDTEEELLKFLRDGLVLY